MSAIKKESDVINTQMLYFTLRDLWRNLLAVTNIDYNLAILITNLPVVPK